MNDLTNNDNEGINDLTRVEEDRTQVKKINFNSKKGDEKTISCKSTNMQIY